MQHPESLNLSACRPGENSQTEALEQLGGEPLIGSGFEARAAGDDLRRNTVAGLGAKHMKNARSRRPIPPPEQRSWLLLGEAAEQIGCGQRRSTAYDAAKLPVSRVCLRCRSGNANGSS